MSCERRKFTRHPIRVPLRCRAQDRDAEIRTRAADLCDGGVSFVSRDPLPAGADVEVVFPIEDQQFALTGTVASCVHDEAAAAYRIGLSFQHPTASFRMKLAEQVLRIHELRRELTRIRGEEVSVDEAATEWIDHYAEKFAAIYA